MLKWKTLPVVVTPAGAEVVSNILAGMSGKNRVIKYMTGPKTASLTLRGYRDADQVVDFDTNLFTTGWTLLPVDVPLAEGQQFSAGFKDEGAGAATYNVVIGYEETG